MLEPSGSSTDRAEKKMSGEKRSMASHDTQASGSSFHDMAAHEQTFRGFILLLEIAAGVSALTLILLFFFFAR
jgi:Bacterial aa3 type cytochrome c oxidase subunit IV